MAVRLEELRLVLVDRLEDLIVVLLRETCDGVPVGGGRVPGLDLQELRAITDSQVGASQRRRGSATGQVLADNGKVAARFGEVQCDLGERTCLVVLAARHPDQPLQRDLPLQSGNLERERPAAVRVQGLLEVGDGRCVAGMTKKRGENPLPVQPVLGGEVGDPAQVLLDLQPVREVEHVELHDLLSRVGSHLKSGHLLPACRPQRGIVLAENGPAEAGTPHLVRPHDHVADPFRRQLVERTGLLHLAAADGEVELVLLDEPAQSGINLVASACPHRVQGIIEGEVMGVEGCLDLLVSLRDEACVLVHGQVGVAGQIRLERGPRLAVAQDHLDEVAVPVALQLGRADRPAQVAAGGGQIVRLPEHVQRRPLRMQDVAGLEALRVPGGLVQRPPCFTDSDAVEKRPELAFHRRIGLGHPFELAERPLGLRVEQTRNPRLGGPQAVPDRVLPEEREAAKSGQRVEAGEDDPGVDLRGLVQGRVRLMGGLAHRVEGGVQLRVGLAGKVKDRRGLG